MYHKIRNVPLSVCTAEQKIAYNLAFANWDVFKKEYERMPCEFQKSEVIHTAIKFMIEQYTRTYTDTRYDVDMIFSALNAGLKTYVKGFPILYSYEQIGETFPALYLKEG